MTLEDRIAAIERHLFGRAQTEAIEAEAEAEVAADVAAEDPTGDPTDANGGDSPTPEPVRDGGPASV